MSALPAERPRRHRSVTDRGRLVSSATMLDVTLRLSGRTLHIVRQLADCEFCENHAAHTSVAMRPFVQAEIERAFQDPAMRPRLRDLVSADMPPPSAHRSLEAEMLNHVRWLLRTQRLLVVECIEVRRELPDLPRATLKALPRGVPVPLEDIKTWVEIELLDDAGKPVANERYTVKIPEGVIMSGTLDAKGRAKITNIDSGMCDISFPEIDGREWKVL